MATVLHVTENLRIAGNYNLQDLVVYNNVFTYTFPFTLA